MDCKREFDLGFWDCTKQKYAKAVSRGLDSRNNTCIPLDTSIKFTRLWIMYNVDTKKRFRQEKDKMVKETNLIKVPMDALSGIGEVC